MSILRMNPDNRPMVCQECQGLMIFKGVGEFVCEDCGAKEYDDYGKVRNYIEQNPGANVSVISDRTGVSRKSINNMLKESRFEVATTSAAYLVCEVCGVALRSGKYCTNCEAAYHKQIEAQMRRRSSKMEGFGIDENASDQGSKRFKRQDL